LTSPANGRGKFIRGKSITLNLQVVAVADGDSGGHVLVVADAIRKRIDTTGVSTEGVLGYMHAR
jgi:hypothetical protein